MSAMSPWTRLLRPLYLLPTCAVLLGVFYAIALLAVRHKCATYDEVIHGPAGYLRLLEGDYRIDPDRHRAAAGDARRGAHRNAGGWGDGGH